MLYHVSPVSGLKKLTPHVSTHQTPYVYAIESMVTGLLFGVRKDDFDFLISTDNSGTPTVYECYPNALESIYQGKSCSVYSVAEEGFLRGMTSWSAELVCPNEVPVLDECSVSDLYQRLLEEEKNGTLILRRYEHTPAYRKLIAGHVIDRLIRFDMDLSRCLEQDPRFALHYRALVQALAAVMDGHLLA